MGQTRRTVLVTGGASGIGLATGKALAARGDRVVLADRDGQRVQLEAHQIGADTLAAELDVTDLRGDRRARRASRQSG